MSRGFLFASAGALLGVALIALCMPARVAARAVDEVVASVDGSPITMHDIRTFAAATGIALPSTDVTSSSTFKQMLKALIEQKLLEQEVKKYQGKIAKSQVDHYIAQIKQQRGLTDEQLRQMLAQNGVSYDAFRKQARLELQKAMMINQEVREKITIPEPEIKAYYEAHRAEFTIKKERYKLAQVLIAVPAGASAQQVAAAKAKAEMVRKQALAGQSFASLARQYSDDASRDQGGELGFFSPGEIMDQILDAVKPLKPGQISQVVHTHYGFHVLKLEQHELAGPIPLADVSQQIREKLADEATTKNLQEWVDTQLVKQHYVETLY